MVVYFRIMTEFDQGAKAKCFAFLMNFKVLRKLEILLILQVKIVPSTETPWKNLLKFSDRYFHSCLVIWSSKSVLRTDKAISLTFIIETQ